MEIKLTTLKPFFEEPEREFHIRELSRILKINHTSVRQHLNNLVKESYLTTKKSRIYKIYKPLISKKYLNLKLFYNLEKLRNSRVIEDLQKFYDFPTIILFGSFAKAQDTKESDIDLAVLTNVKKEFNSKEYERSLNRKVNIHIISNDFLKRMIKKSPDFINNLTNGITLSGKFEIIK